MFPPRFDHRELLRTYPQDCIAAKVYKKSSPRRISTGLLHALLRFHIRPINQVVYLEPYPLKEVGDLILGWASRLDAFSGYPVQT